MNCRQAGPTDQAEAEAAGYDPRHHTVEPSSGATGEPVPGAAGGPSTSAAPTTGTSGQKLPGIPGEPTKLDTKVLDVGRDVLQTFSPLKGVHEHVCGFHFYAHDMTRQVEAHHFCSHPTEELRQCILYDSDKPNARLIGIEYIISERLFQGLPQEEKRLWHSHRYEVQSGMLVAPRVPNFAERTDMEKLAGTYGKTFHFWQVDRGDELPLGLPQLMMAFTQDGQLQPGLLEARDKRYSISTASKREDRRDLRHYPEHTDPGADHWQEGGGTAWQVTLEQVQFKRHAAPGPGSA